MLFEEMSLLLNELADPQVTMGDLSALERVLDRLYRPLGIDIEFTKHFLDRVNDARNGRQITVSELASLFAKEFSKHGDKLANAKENTEAVLLDLSTDINVPFVIKHSSRGGLELLSKTVMRKHNFKTRNRVYRVR